MNDVKVGDRVGTILMANDDGVISLGFGVYEGLHPLEGEVDCGDAALYHGELKLMDDGDETPLLVAPRIRLDDGTVVWGTETRWSDEARVRRHAGDRPINVWPISKVRSMAHEYHAACCKTLEETRASREEFKATAAPGEFTFTLSRHVAHAVATMLPFRGGERDEVIVCVAHDGSALAPFLSRQEPLVRLKSVALAPVRFEAIVDELTRLDEDKLADMLVMLASLRVITSDDAVTALVAMPDGQYHAYHDQEPATRVLTRFRADLLRISAQAAAAMRPLVARYATNTDAMLISFLSPETQPFVVDAKPDGVLLEPPTRARFDATFQDEPLAVEVTTIVIPREVAVASLLEENHEPSFHAKLTRPETAESGLLVQHLFGMCFLHPLHVAGGHAACTDCGLLKPAN